MESLMDNPRPLRDLFPWMDESPPRIPKLSRHSATTPVELPPVTGMAATGDNICIDVRHSVPDLGFQVEIYSETGSHAGELWTRVITCRPDLERATIKVCLRGDSDFLHTRVCLDRRMEDGGWHGNALIGAVSELSRRLGGHLEVNAFIL